MAQKIYPTAEAALDGVLEITEGENGADRQRAIFEKHGSLKAVVEHLVAVTA